MKKEKYWRARLEAAEKRMEELTREHAEAIASGNVKLSQSLDSACWQTLRILKGLKLHYHANFGGK